MKNIKITSSLFLLFLLVSAAISGQQTLLGVVSYEDGSSIPLHPGYDLRDPVGTYTDHNGAFSLSVTSLPALPEFSNVGYEKKQVGIHSSDHTKIPLKQKIVEREEVVVLADDVMHPIGSPKNTRRIAGYRAEAHYQQLALMIKNKDTAFHKPGNAYLPV